MNPDERMGVVLLPARWVRLPGTTWECYLHGKAGEEGVEVVRTHERDEYGGWDLSLVLDRSYIRQVRR